MIVYYAKEFETAEPRAHPWSTSVANKCHAYVDFKVHPSRVRSALEDLQPYSEFPFAEKFYSLIEWLNGRVSVLETNDCAFRGAHENADQQFKFERRCSGRLMILYRDVIENAKATSVDWLLESLCRCIGRANPSFVAGAVGLSRMATIYKALGNGPGTGGLGSQVMLSFFAYGKNDARCYESMERVLDVASISLEKVNRQLKTGALKLLTSVNRSS